MACVVRDDGGADGGTTGGGIHPGEETSSIPLRPPGLPLALISPEGETAWCGEYDEWGNQLKTLSDNKQ